MRVMMVKVAAAAMLLTGCQTTSDMAAGDGAGAPRPVEVESIRYETSRCYGTCPVYAVTVHPNGDGLFEGEQFTAETGARSFTLTRAQYEAFKARLAPLRPSDAERVVTMGAPGCGPYATDMPSVEVRWTGIEGGSQHLRYDLGCRGEGSGGAEALREAPGLLPIEGLIGRR